MRYVNKIKPIVSGQLIFDFVNKEGKLKEYENILGVLKKRIKFIRKKTGSYIFSGGIISNIDLIENKKGLLTASLRFFKAKPHFLDNLTSATLSKSKKSSISCSMSGNFDFDSIKDHLKDNCDWFAESDKSFIAKKKIARNNIQITAYPNMSMLSLLCEFQKGKSVPNSNFPSKLIKNLYKIGGRII